MCNEASRWEQAHKKESGCVKGSNKEQPSYAPIEQARRVTWAHRLIPLGLQYPASIAQTCQHRELDVMPCVLPSCKLTHRRLLPRLAWKTHRELARSMLESNWFPWAQPQLPPEQCPLASQST